MNKEESLVHARMDPVRFVVVVVVVGDRVVRMYKLPIFLVCRCLGMITSCRVDLGIFSGVE